VHNNYFFLRQLTSSLNDLLRSAVVSECFSQNKEELIIRFERKDTPFFIKASLTPSFSCLSFPENFHRARRNSVDLFHNLIGQRVEGLRQFENERSFAINFSNNFTLLFKMHGNRSNIILFHQEVLEEIFRSSIEADTTLNLNKLDRHIDWSYENFVQHQTKPESVYFTFGKVVWKYLRAQRYDNLTSHEQWQAIQDILEQFKNPTFYILQLDGKPIFSLLKFDDVLKEFTDPIKAINEFYFFSTHQDAFTKERSAAISILKTKLQAAENYSDKASQKLSELESDNHYKIWADLLMANINSIAPGSERIVLADFYHENKQVEIKLKKDLSPQKNAAIFYKKSKNQVIEVNHLKQLLANKEEEKKSIKIQLDQIEAAEDLKSLRILVGKLNVISEKERQSIPVPYREVEFNSFKIWIGKNAQGNDALTLKYGYKEDLWLHAKDVAGSHVLLKYQAGKNFPKEVIERAAQLAAYYSKRKNESLCPVIVTPRKFVRKRKGDLPGAVMVDREDVIMVEPKS
jgi:predicted ribosome quality control (RQC) complex YloA/Tae2 family protein